MCGIAGIVGSRAERQLGIRRMLESLKHRGPDGEGTRFGPGIAFGHRRLAIIDLLQGAQPLTNCTGTHWLVCNGEIYNYKELRAELVRRGYRFLTASDCEVILGLYEFYGDALLTRIRGMFAFALWDAPRRRLLAARDHFGQKPFFYVADEDMCLFASEIKALLAYEPRLREPDLRALDQYLGMRLVAAPLTMFRRVRKLPPAHKLVYEEGRGVTVSPYWTLEYQPKRVRSEDRLIEELDEHVTEALRAHLVSDVPVGAFLSGGMDSSLIVAMLSKRLGVRNLPTFTLDLPYRRFSEAHYARTIAAACGTQHHEDPARLNLLSTLPDLVWHSDEPSDPLTLCMFQLAGMARRHVKVALAGDGGDELFGGYDRYYGNLYAGYYSRVPRAVRRYVLGPLMHAVPESNWYKSAGHQMRWVHRASFLRGAERYATSLTYFYFDRALRAKLLTPQVLEQLRDWRAEAAIEERFNAARGDTLDKMLYADAGIRLPDHPVMITDRMAMAWGLEVRSPFMDHRLAEFVARIPSELKVRGRTLRYLQKQLAARYLPPQILNRSKQGFSSALPYLLREDYRHLYRNVLTESALVTAGLVRRPVLERLVQHHFSGRADHGNRLWLLLNAELWYRMHILRHSREDLRAQLTTPRQPAVELAVSRA